MFVTVAVDQMVIDHPGRLHEGINDRRPDELKSAAPTVPSTSPLKPEFPPGTCFTERKRFTFGTPSRNPHSRAENPGPFSIMSSQARADATAPSIFMRLRTMPASCISRSIFLRRVARDFLRHESVEGFAEILALAQDRDPREPRLESVEHELLEERAVVALRHAPFVIVIGDVKRVLPGPRTAALAVGMDAGQPSATPPLWLRRASRSAPRRA